MPTPLLALLLTAAQAGEGPTFVPELQFRPRLEFDTGRDGTAGTGDVAYVTHRARLGASMIWGPVTLRVVLQDVRAWGEEHDTRKDFSADGLDLHFATFTWKPIEGLEVSVGRDESPLLDERLIGRSNWRQAGRAFDGGRIHWKGHGFSVYGFGAVVTAGDTFDFATQDQVKPGLGARSLYAVSAGRDTDRLSAQAVGVFDVRKDKDTVRETVGARVEGNLGILSGRLEGYAQLGHIGDRAVRAYMIGASGTVAPAVRGRPTITLWYDLISGDADPGDDVATSFDTLYGAGHRYYGTMDVANYVQGGQSDGRGLHDAALKLGATPHERVRLVLDDHVFATPVAADGRHLLAFEPDLEIWVQAHDLVGVSAGASAWVPLDGSGHATDAWAWLMLDLRFAGPRLTVPPKAKPADRPAT